MVKISPSILAADFSALGEDVKKLEKYGADFIHIDVMDGNFVPNISLGIPVIKSIRKHTELPFDVHLMIENPGRYIDDFIAAGADILTVHYEADRHIDRTISYIKSKGVKAAIALNPGTSVSAIKDLISKLDMVLIMTVNPGFGGQSFIPYTMDKVRELRDMADVLNPQLFIQVDGGIDKTNIKSIVQCGANVVVAGSSVFAQGKVEENIKDLKEALK
jgi:ribulose-phosphate 3-epimerase